MTELTLTHTQTGVLLTSMRSREISLVNFLEEMDTGPGRAHCAEMIASAEDSLAAVRQIIAQCGG